MKKHIWRIFAGSLLPLALLTVGCTAQPPDTSAPERVEVERSADWRGALLYLADEEGPTPGWGSVRIYDNVSALVEKTVEQTVAAQPSDLFVTPEGSSMYVASRANGRIDKWRWDGNNWIRGGVVIETEADQLSALVPGPDGKLYALSGSPASGTAIVIDPAQDRPSGGLTVPGTSALYGLAWAPDASRLYALVQSATGTQLLICSWPAATPLESIELTLSNPGQIVASPDGRFVYAMGRGEIRMIDLNSKTTAALKPAPEPEVGYRDAAFSADGAFLFVSGNQPGGDGSIYVFDLKSNSTVQTLRHVGVKVNGLQRVE